MTTMKAATATAAAGAAAATTMTTGIQMSSPTAVLASVTDYYSKVLTTTKDLKTTACTACGAPPPHVRAALKKIPAPVLEKFYGCGNPVPRSIAGLTVLDLGCGSGRDCYVAALYSGKAGRVIGIDMTDEQLAVARGCAAEFAAANPDAAPMTFLRGYIEDIGGAGVEPNSVDLIISNCVVNLSPNKAAVLEGAFRALRPGGEMHFSDVYCDRRLPESVRKHEVLFGECLSGALYINDFLSLARRVGFTDPRELSSSDIKVLDEELAGLVGGAKYFSKTFRLFKLPELDDKCEDYGQIAYYRGGVAEEPFGYTLDDHHFFEKDKPVLVCGNTADMLSATWLKPFFQVVGDKSKHFGAFPCGGPAVAAVAGKAAPAAASDCSGGGCC